jgi:PHD/YefM family antitoxin component YafN of YafNO toxin-antitoxin module
VKAVEQKKDVVTVRADWKSNYYSGPSRFEFMLDGEQILELRIEGE